MVKIHLMRGAATKMSRVPGRRVKTGPWAFALSLPHTSAVIPDKRAARRSGTDA